MSPVQVPRGLEEGLNALNRGMSRIDPEFAREEVETQSTIVNQRSEVIWLR